MGQLILASASPRRKKLLGKLNLSFEVHPSTVSETYEPGLTASEIVELLSLRKAKDVASVHRNSLIIGADTIVSFEDEILEKPSDNDEARHILSKLSGNEHQVYTGVSLCITNGAHKISKSVTFVEMTSVLFGSIPMDQINQYVASGAPLDKAGGYGIQDDFGAKFIQGIRGDFYNVIGFPLHAFYNNMSSFARNYLAVSNSKYQPE